MVEEEQHNLQLRIRQDVSLDHIHTMAQIFVLLYWKVDRMEVLDLVYTAPCFQSRNIIVVNQLALPVKHSVYTGEQFWSENGLKTEQCKQAKSTTTRYVREQVSL